MRKIRKSLYYSTAIFALLFLFCIDEYNPFDDPANIKLSVESCSFLNGDSVSVFNTQTIVVAPLIKEKIDSFTIRVDDNRLWSNGEITVVNNNSISDLDTFQISFSDTGSKNIEIITFHSNNKKHIQNYSLYAYLKLSQAPVNASFGESITLFANTEGVTDSDIRFQWDFGYSIITSYEPEIKTAIVAAAENGLNGILTISDKMGLCCSPEVKFNFIFYDTTGPDIECINEVYEPGKDTIITGDSIFALKVKIIDRGQVFASSATINDSSFTNYNIHEKYYYNIFPEMYKHQYQTDTPIIAIIEANDVMSPPNTTKDTFWLYFDKDSNTTNSIIVKINNIDNNSTVQDSNFIIFGSVENNKNNDLIIKLSNNGNLITSGDTVLTGNGNWFFPLSLSDSNFICVKAFNYNNDSLAAKSVFFFYDKNIIDSIKPKIWRITIDNTVISSLNKPIFTQNTSAAINIIAFDNESRVKDVLISGETANRITETEWYKQINIPHSMNNKKISIEVLDINSNSLDTNIIVIQNKLPTLNNNTTDFILDINSTVVLPISTNDDDGDQVGIHIEYKQDWLQKKGDTLTGISPATGSDSIVFFLSDGFQSTKTFTWNYSVVEQVKFSSSLNNQLPTWLVAEKDTFNTILSTESGTAPFIYNATLIPDDSILLNNTTNNLLQWIPSSSNIGKKTLKITVSDQSQTGDTLFHTFTVLPKNSYECSLSVQVNPDSVLIGDTIDLSDTVSAMLNFTIHDDDPGIHEKYIVTINRFNGSKTFETDSFQFNETVFPLLSKKVNIEQFDVSIIDTSNILRKPYYMTLFIKHPWSVSSIDSLILWHDAKIGVELQSGTNTVNKWRDVKKQNEFLINDENNPVYHPLFVDDSDIPTINFINSQQNSYMEKPDSGNWSDANFSALFVADLNLEVATDIHYTLLSSTDNVNSYSLGVIGNVPGVFKSDISVTIDGYTDKYDQLKPNRFYLLSFRFDTLSNKSMYISLNGVPDTIDLDLCNCMVSSNQNLIVGAEKKDPIIEFGWKGGIAEIIVFKKFLNNSDHTRVEQYLSEKYGITLYDKSLLKEEYR